MEIPLCFSKLCYKQKTKKSKKAQMGLSERVDGRERIYMKKIFRRIYK
jgi:hypothetical protein